MFHWIKPKVEVDKTKIVKEKVIVKATRVKRGGKSTLDVRKEIKTSKSGKVGNGAKGKKRVKGVVQKDDEVIKAKPKGSGNSKVNGLGSG